MNACTPFQILRRALALAALAIGLNVAPAAATTFAVGAVTTSPYINSVVLPAGSFSDTYTFSLAAPTELAASVVSLDLVLSGLSLLHVSNLQMSLYDGAAWLGTWSGNPSSFQATLGTGSSYSLVLSGLADGLSGGSYLFSIAAAIPEPGQWLLFAAGLALLGMMAVRRKRGDNRA